MFYVKDRDTGEMVLKETVDGVISCLEEYCHNAFNKTRKQYMLDLIELGYGYDDDDGEVFTRAMTKYLDIGVVRKTELGPKFKECCIHEYMRSQKYKDETGD